ncbi:MAG: DUF1643 domain-containing protein [Gemmataceae bacterium]
MLTATIHGSAQFSRCGRYRYRLTRHWGVGPRVTFVMLNPSTADAERNDPTIRKCIGFAQRWGCGRLQVVNLFALRATSPAELRRVSDPVGPRNRGMIERVLAEPGGIVVCAWGVHGQLMEQGDKVAAWLEHIGNRELMCLGRTSAGHPRHPLYLPYTANLIPY